MKRKLIAPTKYNFFFVLIIIVAFQFSTLKANNKEALLRFPDVHDSTIVFVSGDDIWSVSVNGGIATRLTINDGQEHFPKFSPDGSLIAFSGEYDGNVDVYVMNRFGGDIKRVTYHPGYDQVVGWSEQKNKIIFSSRRNSSNRYSKLFLISPNGTGLEELIMYDAGQGSFSPDETKIAYNKIARENRTWKRYTGGTAQEVYVYDFNTNTEENITNFNGTDRIPMWIGNKIYFTSDRERVLNIFAYNTNTKEIEKITNHVDYDVRRPGFDKENIVYEHGGDIWILNIKTKEYHKVPVSIKADFPELRPYLKDVKENITQINISPTGKRALLTARGEIFTVPEKEGVTVNITKSAGSREKDAIWSPDGKSIAYLSDASGEYEIYIETANGNKQAIKLTNYETGYRHTLKWSPNSKKIAFTDQTLTLFVLDIDSKKITKVDKAEYENIDVSQDKKPMFDYSWSPDSRYITYSKMNENLLYQVYIYELETARIYNASNGLFSDFNPVFAKDGNYLLFISNRRFNPTFCDVEWEMVYKKLAGIYALSLQKSGSSILPFENDKEGSDNSTIMKGHSMKMIIDFDGLADRIEALPLERGNYRNLTVNKSYVFYTNGEDGDYNRFEFRSLGAQTLYRYSYKDKKEEIVIEKIDAYKLSFDGLKIIYKKGKEVGIISSDATNSQGNSIDLSGLKMMMYPKAEWMQMFNEAWRMERDYYYEPKIHGLDWNLMKDKYGKLMERATCRQDVRFVIGELIGELNTSHTYIYGGDYERKAEYVNTGMLGVDWQTDATNKLYRFGKIYNVPGWSRGINPPLAKPGVNVKEGDYLLAVNGTKVTSTNNIYRYFINTANKQTVLLVNNKPSFDGAREVTVKPAYSEGRLRYLYQLEQNRLAVDKASGGKIGYIYMPDTYLGSATDFPKYFYAQSRKEGLILDGRFNGGGLDPSIFLQRLRKQPLSYWTRRYSHDQMGPNMAVRAHLACLTNRYAGSGGDMLPDEFKMLKMGPVIGTRTWGGLVGVSMSIKLIDGGELTAPDYRIYNAKGDWIVENYGVDPNIVVEQNSVDLSKGKDTQLMKAVEVLLKVIEEKPIVWPKHEEYPVDNE
ncbi:MAG: peptidase S41 [Chlorobi bacterium]|nr:peptidase S41 [Chlorobiota bacterium]